MAYLADKASDGGEGVYCSKGTVANETEIARSTAFKVMGELVEEGILIPTGRRACKTGATVEYRIDLAAIRALPEVKPDMSSAQTSPSDGPHQSASQTPTSPPAGPVRPVTSPPAGPPQSVRRTPTSPSAGPKPPLEPSLNIDDDDHARELDDFRGKILEAIGLDPDARTALGGPAEMAEARRWLDLPHVTEELACAQIRSVMARKGGEPPRTLTYFSDEMLRLSAELEAVQTPLATAPATATRSQVRPRPSGSVPMTPRAAAVDLDALAAMWAGKIISGNYIPQSAISPALGRHMIGQGLVKPEDLRRVGVAV